MKKKFKQGELVRIKRTLIYGSVESQFSTDEYYCTFDCGTGRYNESEISYGIFKQLLEWIKFVDNKTTEEMENSITYLYQNLGWIAVLKRFVFGTSLFFLFWLCVWVFSLI